MRKNMGMIDRVMRFLIGAVIVILFFTHAISGIAAIVFGIISIIFILTSFIGVCPLYLPLKVDTLRKRE